MTFRLVNQGDSPVRILSAESGCGCAEPRLSRSIVEPGGSTTVRVLAIGVGTGEKTVTLRFRTDSSIRPEVVVPLRMIGTRNPPYLLSLLGDLGFRGKASVGLTREFQLLTVESRAETKEPSVVLDLPFLEARKLGEKIEPRGDDEGGIVTRTRTYQVRLASRPPSPTFSGTLIVTDPWNAVRFEQLRVFGQFQSSIRVLPPALRLNAGEQRTVVVSSTEPSERLRIHWEGKDPGPLLTIGPIERSANGRLFRFEFEVRAGTDATASWSGEARVLLAGLEEDAGLSVELMAGGQP